MKPPSTERVARAALLLREQGYADVAALLMKKEKAARDELKPRRQKGTQVRLLGGKVKAVLPEEKVREALKDSKS